MKILCGLGVALVLMGRILNAGDLALIEIDAGQTIGSSEILSNYVAIQGGPMNSGDSKEAKMWKQLRLKTETVPLLNDLGYYGEGGIHVSRAKPAEGRHVHGPFGPANDLWLDTTEFDAHLQVWQNTLGMELHQIGLAIEVMPNEISYNPTSQYWMKMSPAVQDEWIGVIRETAFHLAELGFLYPEINFFGELENYFRGTDQPLGSHQAFRDHAELYILTQNALHEILPEARLISPSTGTYSRYITQDLRNNPDELGIEDWLTLLRETDPNFIPSALAWQGYYWYGLDGFGPKRLLEGSDYIRTDW